VPTSTADDRARLPRVLFAIGGLGAGGSETQLTELLTRAHGRELDAILVTTTEESAGGRRERVQRVGVELHTIGAIDAPRILRPPITARRYAALLRALRPDVVYAWLEQTSMYLVPAARALGIPVVVARRSVIGAAIETQRPLVGRAIRRVETLAPLVTCNSEAVMRQAVARGIRRDRLRLVRNGHPPLDALPMPSSDGEIRLGYLARFRPEKGHRRLIRTLALMDRSLPWRVLLGGGGGGLEEQVRADVEAAGLGDRVDFLGEIADARAFWGSCHIAVLLSDSEGSPNSLIEAAFAGRPLVATRVDGTIELVREGTGDLCDLDDDAGTARALERLVADAGLRRELGAGAHAMASATFAIDAAVRGHVDALREALNGRP
jgi:glycosyltransferase involved in cell wall biosynthesis